MMRSRDKTALITDAQRGRDEEMRIRQVRYIAMMSLRAVLLVVAAVLVMTEAPMLWLWVTLCAVGMVVLPWVAVIVANDRLPQDKHRIFRRHRRTSGDHDTQLTTEPSVVVDGDSRKDDTA